MSDEKGNVIATFIKATFEGAPAIARAYVTATKSLKSTALRCSENHSAKSANSSRTAELPAKILVERYGTGKRETGELSATLFRTSIAEAYMVRPGVGYIAMTGCSITRPTPNSGSDARFEIAGMKQLVLDLRNNGGSRQSGLSNRQYVFGNGQIVFTQKAELTVQPALSKLNDSPDDTPMVLLVNRNSARLRKF